jgi:capsular exopolysaccharide synthesis family protein
MELRHYLQLLRRSLWLLLAAPVIAGLVAGGVSLRLAPVYEAHVELLVRPSQVLPVDTGVAAVTSDQISRTYAQLMVQRPLLEQVIKDLGLNESPDRLQGQITVTPQPNTTILDVAVTSTNPALARDVANTLVDDFIDQIKAIQEQELSQPNPRQEDNLVVVSPAVTPTSPVSPNIPRNILLAAAAGLLLAVAVVVLREYLDQTIKSDEELVRRGGVVPIGHIAYFEAPKGRRGELVVLDPKSAVAEAYRALRTNLLFSTLDREVKTIVISSSGPGEGKSRTAANLSVALAQAGYRTLLIDADFRRPSQHRIFGWVRNIGLSNLMIQDVPEEELIKAVDGVPNLHVVTSGPTPPNPSELLGSARMRAVIAAMRQRFHYVVIDTPPVNAVTDPTVIAPAVDGVVLIAETHRTTYPGLAHARDAIERVGGHVLGVVVNKVRADRAGYYEGYHYYYGYYGEDGTRRRHSNGRGRGRADAEPAAAGTGTAKGA